MSAAQDPAREPEAPDGGMVMIAYLVVGLVVVGSVALAVLMSF